MMSCVLELICWSHGRLCNIHLSLLVICLSLGSSSSIYVIIVFFSHWLPPRGAGCRWWDVKSARTAVLLM